MRSMKSADRRRAPLKGPACAPIEKPMTGLQVAHAEFSGEELMDGFNVVANGGHRKARSVEWLWGIAGRGGAAVAEEFSGDEEHACGIQGFARAGCPC